MTLCYFEVVGVMCRCDLNSTCTEFLFNIFIRNNGDRFIKDGQDKVLADEVRKVLDENKAERHIRGGMATKLKYEHDREDKEAV